MNVAEFINKCDWEGGLSQGFESGLCPSDLAKEADAELFNAVFDAYEGWSIYKRAADRYYTLVETGEY